MDMFFYYCNFILQCAYKKFAETSVQRYYLLSTVSPQDDQYEKIQDTITEIRNEHGCQVINNGVFPTLKYYLRLLENTDRFMNCYVKNLENDTELNYEHKIAWNTIVNG